MEQNNQLHEKISKKQDIDYVFLFKGYTIMVMQNGSNEVLDLPLCSIEKWLTDQPFFRIHRSYLVNLRRINELKIRNKQLLIPIRGHELPVARRKKKQLLDMLGMVN